MLSHIALRFALVLGPEMALEDSLRGQHCYQVLLDWRQKLCFVFRLEMMQDTVCGLPVDSGRVGARHAHNVDSSEPETPFRRNMCSAKYILPTITPPPLAAADMLVLFCFWSRELWPV
jgi:hypothetical protein